MKFSELYPRMNEKVSPSREAKETVLEAARKGKTGENRRLRPAVVFAICLACLIALSLPVCVLAAENPGVNAVVYRISPALGQFFKPVNLSCENNGIRLEVESASVNGDTARAHVSLRDLTGDRIDETVDLNDSARFRQGKDSVSSCQLADYDSETGTARFLLTSTTMDGSDIAGEKITFQASCFLSRKKNYENVEIPVDWAALPGSSPSVKAPCSGGGTGFASVITVLEPEKPLDWSVKGIDLTGIGFVEGMLHVQTLVEGNLKKDNHGWFWLEDEDGNQIKGRGAYFQMDGDSYGDTCRVEYVFDVSREELEGCTLHGTFQTSGLYTEGNWEVTFPVK